VPLELERVLALGQALELELVQAPVLGLGLHSQLPNLQLITVPAESTIFSFSLIYFLPRFYNLSIVKFLC